MAARIAVDANDRSRASTGRAHALSFAVAGPLAGPHGLSVAKFVGIFSVTAFDLKEASLPVCITGVLNGVVTFPDDTDACIVVDDEEVTTTAALKNGFGISSASSIYHLAAASCSIPLLTLGRVEIRSIGLYADLREIVLEVSRDSGAESLVGTLLSALVTDTPVSEISQQT